MESIILRRIGRGEQEAIDFAPLSSGGVLGAFPSDADASDPSETARPRQSTENLGSAPKIKRGQCRNVFAFCGFCLSGPDSCPVTGHLGLSVFNQINQRRRESITINPDFKKVPDRFGFLHRCKYKDKWRHTHLAS